MNVTLTFADGRTETVPLHADTTVKFLWQTKSDDGYRTVDNEEAFALADVTAMSVETDAPEPTVDEPAVTETEPAPAADVAPAVDAAPADEAAAVDPPVAADSSSSSVPPTTSST